MKSSNFHSELRNRQYHKVPGKQRVVPQFKTAPIIWDKDKTKKCMSAVVAQNSGSNRHVPIELRMSVKFNKVDQFKSTFKPQPVKRLALPPVWKNWPLDSKIPDYRTTARPEGSFYFTRGKLCQSLYSRRQEFDLTDPKGNRNAVLMSDYTGLHDPMAQRYFKSPTVLCRLQSRQLINDKNDVLCDVRNYNQYRSYLASLQSEIIEEEIKRSNELYNMTQDIRKASQDYTKSQSLAIDPVDKLSKARESQTALNFQKVKDVEERINKWGKKISTIQKRRILQRLAAAELLSAADNRSQMMRHKKYMESDFRRRKLLADLLQSEIRSGQHSNLRPPRVLAKEQKETERLLALQVKNQRDLELTESLEQDRILWKRGWIRDYEKHIVFVKNNQENIRARREAKTERVHWIRRKYFDLWRKIAASHRERPNSAHISCWKTGHELEVVIWHLEELPELAGYDPHHNIFNSVLGKGNVKNWKTQLEEEIQKEDLEGQAEKNQQEEAEEQQDDDREDIIQLEDHDDEYVADEESENLGFVENDE